MFKTLIAAILAVFMVTVAASPEDNEGGNSSSSASAGASIYAPDYSRDYNSAYSGASVYAPDYSRTSAGASVYAPSYSSDRVDVNNRTTNKVRTSARQDQDQSQRQGQVGVNVQEGTIQNVGPQVVVTDKSIVTYDAPSYAPGVDVRSTAPCTIGVGGSFGNGAISIGASSGYTDEVCQDLEVIRIGMFGDQEMRDLAKGLYLLVLSDRSAKRAKADTTPSVTSTPDS